MFKRLFQFSFYLLLICFTQILFAQTLSDRVDSIIEKALIERHIPGLSLAVIQDGVPVKVKGYGFSNIENKTPVNPETIFQSGCSNYKRKNIKPRKFTINGFSCKTK